MSELTTPTLIDPRNYDNWQQLLTARPSSIFCTSASFLQTAVEGTMTQVRARKKPKIRGEPLLFIFIKGVVMPDVSFVLISGFLFVASRKGSQRRIEGCYP